jgi:hypothetical protein
MGQWGLGRYMGTPDRWVCDGDTLFVHEKKTPHTSLHCTKIVKKFLNKAVRRNFYKNKSEKVQLLFTLS